MVGEAARVVHARRDARGEPWHGAFDGPDVEGFDLHQQHIPTLGRSGADHGFRTITEIRGAVSRPGLGQLDRQQTELGNEHRRRGVAVIAFGGGPFQRMMGPHAQPREQRELRDARHR